jgi:uncharacterized protein (TIGR00661 family)
MARIVYGVAGEGFGHSSRSHLIGQHLIDAGHDVLFVASRRSLAYLQKHFGPKVRAAFGLSLVYDNRTLSPWRTITTNTSRFIAKRSDVARFCTDTLDPFEPDVVISDFEPVSAWWAWRRRVPFVSVNHQHLLTMCKLEHEPSEWLSRLNAHVVTRCHYVGAAAYIILNFFRAPVTDERAVLAPPVVRPIVRDAEPTSGDHIVVYTSDASWNDGLLDVLRSFGDQPFRVYGFDRDERVGNCQLRPTSTDGFVADVAHSRGVIATGGFTLISECLHLGKKMLVLPIQGQYEQIVNAHYAEKLGLALHRRKLDVRALGEYLETLKEPLLDHPDILRPDNDAFLYLLEQRLGEVCPAFTPTATALPHEDTPAPNTARTGRNTRRRPRLFTQKAYGY